MGDAAEVQARQREVAGLLQHGKHREAVKAALKNPPLASHDKAVKDMNAEIVLNAICSASDNEIDKIVADLYHNGTPDLCDTLVKYIYKGLADHKYCGVLLKWHASAVNMAGLGPVVRAMTDRKTV